MRLFCAAAAPGGRCSTWSARATSAASRTSRSATAGAAQLSADHQPEFLLSWPSFYFKKSSFESVLMLEVGNTKYGRTALFEDDPYPMNNP